VLGRILCPNSLHLVKPGTIPIAILNRECETIVAVPTIIAQIPCMGRIDIYRVPDAARLLVDRVDEKF